MGVGWEQKKVHRDSRTSTDLWEPKNSLMNEKVGQDRIKKEIKTFLELNESENTTFGAQGRQFKEASSQQ